MLQRRGALGIWFNVDNKYGHRTAYQSSEIHYDPRNKGRVHGGINLLTWLADKSGEYRIIMEDPSAPQETVISRFEEWGNNPL